MITNNMQTSSQRKIIHIDMDCFYAAIEVRDNPALNTLPVAVGGSASGRGVLCTCNYVARKYGVRSAMATAHALKLCPELVLVPVNMAKYKQASKRIQAIFHEYTDLVEPLSLDEAFIDVTECTEHKGSATLIAEEIRRKILETENLKASAGVSCNKFLAKIASGWNKPNGIFVIRPNEVENFIAKLSVKHLFGVGKVTAEKMAKHNLHTCTDLQRLSLIELSNKFGKLGTQLYYQVRGIDNRPVNPNRVRKSLSVETTFTKNINDIAVIHIKLRELYQNLLLRLEAANLTTQIKSQFIKIKFGDFIQTTAETATLAVSLEKFITLFDQRYVNFNKEIRLLGLGVSFSQELKEQQPTLF